MIDAGFTSAYFDTLIRGYSPKLLRGKKSIMFHLLHLFCWRWGFRQFGQKSPAHRARV